MAKRKVSRKSTNRSKSKSYSKPKRKSSSRRGMGKGLNIMGTNLVNDILVPGVYGAVRQKIANVVIPYARQLPFANQLGNNVDEAGMIVALTVGKKFLGNKVPIVKDIARAGIMIEAAQIGQDIANGTTGIGTPTTGGSKTITIG